MADEKRKTRAKANPEQAADKPVRGYVIDSDDPAEVAAGLARQLPEWEDMKQGQRDALVAQSMTSRARPVRAKLGVTKGADGSVQISPPEKDQGSHALRIYETFATASDDFVMESLKSIHRHFMAHDKSPTAEEMSAILAFVGGCNPENEQQAGMALQMALFQDAAINALGKAQRTEYMDNYEKFSNAANKLARTFAVLTDSYAKLQRGGVQTVKHVNVYEGGQAVVTDQFNHIGGFNAGTNKSAHTTSVSPAMLGRDPHGNGVPVSGRRGQEAMPDARWGEGQRRPEGQQERLEARLANCGLHEADAALP